MPASDLPATDPQRLALAWRIAPASIAFILDTRVASASGRDLVDSLLFAAIVSANVALLSRDADLQMTYAGLNDAPPDSIRRPVSVNAVAHSLRMPFETVRRRVAGMARDGALELTPRGVQVPGSIITDPGFLAAAVRRHHRLGVFLDAIRAAGALPEPVTPSVAAPAAPPIRATNRLLWEYLLRITDEIVEVTGDPLSALIILHIVRRNIAELAPADLAAWIRDPAGVGRPVRNAGLAASLDISPETARRYIIRLEAAGLCRRTAKGVVATAPAALRPTLDRLALDNLANVQRMFARLDQLGLLGAWEAAPAAPSVGGLSG